MILLFAVAAWILAISIVAGLCTAARAGDAAGCVRPSAGGGSHTTRRRPSQNRHVATLRRLDHTRSTIESVESAMAAHADVPARAHEGSHPVHRTDRKLIASTGTPGRAVRELWRAAGL